jgi:hypothetical protein
MMKKYILLLVFLTQSFAFSQELKEVTLTQIGVGKTKDASKYNALRNALEKAFGAFISSNTTLLNDALIKDEIVSVSSGNIQNFEILSETQMPDSSYSSVVKATVSIGKLTSFCENKGITVEFKGGLFAANIKLQELNKKNEEAVMENLFTILNKIVAKGFDFKIEVSEPKKDTYNNDNWIVDFSVTASANKNLENIKDIILNTINNICLSPQEITAYSNQNIKMYRIKFNGKDYYFRSSFSIIYLSTIFEKKIPLASLNFSVSDGIILNDCISMLSTKLNPNVSRIKKDWPCLNSSKEDCGYRNPIKAKYFILFNNYERPSPLNNKISDFIMGINKINFNEINNSFIAFDSGNEPLNIYLNQLNPKEANGGIEIIYNFKNTYSMQQLSKITEYKVHPIIK